MIFKVSFASISLEEVGLVRLIEACNQNKNILQLNVGILTDKGLSRLAELLKENNSLEEILIEETKDHQKYWSDHGRHAFTKMLQTFTTLKRVKIIATQKESDADETAKHDLFIQEIDFYTHNKTAEQCKLKEYERILKGCEPDSLFELMLKNIEEKKENCKMPVRKFFDNTFGNLLNDALFNL